MKCSQITCFSHCIDNIDQKMPCIYLPENQTQDLEFKKILKTLGCQHYLNNEVEGFGFLLNMPFGQLFYVIKCDSFAKKNGNIAQYRLTFKLKKRWTQLNHL